MTKRYCCSLMLFIGAQVLAAPALSPDQLRMKVAQMADRDFCSSLGKTLRSPTVENMHYRAALIWRAKLEGITKPMLDGIEERRPVIGMNVCAVIAALGSPEASNRTVGKFGQHVQLVYRSRRLYVYLDDNVVSAWQD